MIWKLCSERRERDFDGAVIAMGPALIVGADPYRLLARRYFSAQAITWRSFGNSRQTRASACVSARCRSLVAGGVELAGVTVAAAGLAFGD
jgi:hypothetical protein